jgi:hypothetical protein
MTFCRMPLAHMVSVLVLQRLPTKMKYFQLIVAAVMIAFASAFAPNNNNKAMSFKLAASKVPEPMKEIRDHKNAAAMAAFATAVAPFAAHATDVDEATVIGYGAGLVACVVSLAVGFAIGYGTLVKL